MESNTIPVLQTEPVRGLTEAQARQRQAAGLRNTPPPDLTKSTARILRDNLLTFYNLLFLALAGCLVAVGAVQSEDAVAVGQNLKAGESAAMGTAVTVEFRDPTAPPDGDDVKPE